MTSKEYQEIVEKKFGKPLKEVMYGLCVEQNAVPAEGARILNVPIETFSYWRNYFRMGSIQRGCHLAESIRQDLLDEYKNQLSGVDIKRPFKHLNEISIDGFQEVMVRYLELIKAKQILNQGLDLPMMTLHTSSIEQVLQYLNDYQKGKLQNEYLTEVKLYEDVC